MILFVDNLETRLIKRDDDQDKLTLDDIFESLTHHQWRTQKQTRQGTRWKLAERVRGH